MSNSVYIPLKRQPHSVGEVQQVVHHAFEELDLAQPEVQLHQPESPPKPLSASTVTVDGAGSHDHCWITFHEYPTELTGPDATTHMASVTTRGSWLFSAIVVLSFFEFGGSRAFNDSGELDGQPEYDAASLRKVIGDALASGNRYLAR